jgi:diketogulonate reductase-like aldo/keto reductase
VVAQQGRAPIVPILGARTERQMRENLEALAIEIPAEQIRRLDEAAAPVLGFPHDFLKDDEVRGLIFGDTFDLIQQKRAG